MKREIELENDWAVIALPVESVEVNIEVKVFHDSELITVVNKMYLPDIRDAFKRGDDGYTDDDEMFVLTESGKAYLESICLEPGNEL